MGSLHAEPTVTVDAYLEARANGVVAVERKFLSRLRLRNGVFKVTWAHRLDDTAQLLAAHARQWSKRTVRVLDVACSSGVSTLELHQTLVQAGVPAQTTGTDLVVAGTYVGSTRDGLLFNPGGRILQLESGGLATPWYWWRRRETRCRPGRQLLTHLRGWWRSGRFRRAASGQSSGPSNGLRVVAVPLTCSAVTSAVTVVEEDLTRPKDLGTFDIIRAANILNRGYFPERRLRAMVQSLVGRLSGDGLLLVARSDDFNLTSLFALRGARPVEIDRLNGGCDIRDLVLA